ncbi:MAG TPA: 4'-phosphopantetheinyl transferase superfamily protein [Gemmatimonadales bacterium]|nr:4'-phosphopantetheinyl transferase superfamily protein [Gemmatimonadales bacterium]
MSQFQLTTGDVHCWAVPLAASREAMARFCATLSPNERERTLRLRFEHHRRRFVIAHGVLRELLGRYCETEPRRLRFVNEPYGKPELHPEFDGRLKFNLSHSADLAVIALAAGTDIGVDIEQIRDGPRSEYAEIASCFFSAPDREHLQRVPAHLYARAFYGCWTRKEAYVKARGDNLATSLDSLAVPPPSWTFFPVHPAPGYIGALAIEGTNWRVTQRTWPGPPGQVIAAPPPPARSRRAHSVSPAPRRTSG